MKNKIIDFLLGNIVTIIYSFSSVVFSFVTYLFVTKLDFVNVYSFGSGLLLYVFIFSISFFILMVLYQFGLYEWLNRVDYKIGYKIYKKYRIEEKNYKLKIEKQKKERKFNSLKLDINKKQKDEISPLRSIIIKKLEDEHI